MAHGITGIDHLLWGVADRAGAEAALRRLGFALAPQGLLFDRGAVELGDQGGGLLGITFGSQNLDATRASLLAEGIALGDQQELPAEATAGYRGRIARSDDLRRPEWTVHPNTALSLQSLTVVVDRPDSYMAGYDKLFGLYATTPTDEMVTVHTGGGIIFLVSPDGFDHLHPQMTLRLPPAPALVALSIGVADLEATERVLKAAGVGYRSYGDSLAVEPSAALGVGLEFVAG